MKCTNALPFEKATRLELKFGISGMVKICLQRVS